MTTGTNKLYSASTYKKILEASDEGIIVVKDEEIVFFNSAALVISEYPAEIYVNTPISKIFHPDDVERIMDYHQKRIKGESAPSFIEGRYLTYTGEERWMQLNSSLLDWENELATVIFISDITDRKHNEAKFTAAFQVAGSALAIRDMQSKRFEHVNDEFSNLTGLLPSEVLNQSPVDIGLISEKDELTIQQAMEKQGRIKDLLIPINRPDGTIRWGLYSAELINFGAKQNLISVTVDVTEHKAQKEEIEKLAMTDPLTGLSNRNSFNDKFEQYLHLSKRRQTNLTLLLLDLDLFKAVNDNFGHQAGDAVLIKVAEILTQRCRKVDVIARLGGDEFAILLFSPRSDKDVINISNDLIEQICKPIQIDGKNVQIGVSIGAASSPKDGETLDKVFQQADEALYESKNGGRNRLTIYQSK